MVFGNKKLFKNNQEEISCILDGTYICKWTYSPKLSIEHGKPFYTYEVMTVLNRSGIRFHSANYFFQLLGCIALGDAHKDIYANQRRRPIRRRGPCTIW